LMGRAMVGGSRWLRSGELGFRSLGLGIVSTAILFGPRW